MSGVVAYASALFGDVESLNNRRGGGADGTNDRRTFSMRPSLSSTSLMRCGDGSGVQQHGDAGFLHLFPGEFAELRRYFGQDLVLGMDKADDNIFLAEISIKAGAAANEFIDFAGDFYAAGIR